MPGKNVCDFDSRMNLSALKWESKDHRKNRHCNERRGGRAYIEECCREAATAYSVGDQRKELIREANYVQRIFDREYQKWALELAARGVRIGHDVMNIAAQACGVLKKGDSRHRYYRTTIPAAFRAIRSRNELVRDNPYLYKEFAELVDMARKARWAKLCKTDDGKKICNVQGVPLINVFKRERVGLIQDLQLGEKAASSCGIAAQKGATKSLPTRSTIFAEEWDKLMYILGRSIDLTRKRVHFVPGLIKPKWYCTRKAIVHVKSGRKDWQQHVHKEHGPTIPLLKKTSSKLHDKKPELLLSGVERHKHVYGRDRTGNRSPPLVEESSALDLTGSEMSSASSRNGVRSIMSDEDSLVLKALMEANEHSCREFLDSFSAKNADVFSGSAPPVRDQGKAGTQGEMFQLLMDALHKKVLEQMEDIELAQEQGSKEELMALLTPSVEQEQQLLQETSTKPLRPSSMKKAKTLEKTIESSSAKGKRPSTAGSARQGDIAGSSDMTSNISKLLLNAFCSAIYETLNKIRSSPQMSPNDIDELLEAALQIASDEELFASLFESVTLVSESSRTSDMLPPKHGREANERLKYSQRGMPHYIPAETFGQYDQDQIQANPDVYTVREERTHILSDAQYYCKDQPHHYPEDFSQYRGKTPPISPSGPDRWDARGHDLPEQYYADQEDQQYYAADPSWYPAENQPEMAHTQTHLQQRGQFDPSQFYSAEDQYGAYTANSSQHLMQNPPISSPGRENKSEKGLSNPSLFYVENEPEYYTENISQYLSQDQPPVPSRTYSSQLKSQSNASSYYTARDELLKSQSNASSYYTARDELHAGSLNQYKVENQQEMPTRREGWKQSLASVPQYYKDEGQRYADTVNEYQAQHQAAYPAWHDGARQKSLDNLDPYTGQGPDTPDQYPGLSIPPTATPRRKSAQQKGVDMFFQPQSESFPQHVVERPTLSPRRQSSIQKGVNNLTQHYATEDQQAYYDQNLPDDYPAPAVGEDSRTLQKHKKLFSTEAPAYRNSSGEMSAGFDFNAQQTESGHIDEGGK